MTEKEIEERTQWFRKELQSLGWNQEQIEEEINSPATQQALKAGFHRDWLEMITM